MFYKTIKSIVLLIFVGLVFSACSLPFKNKEIVEGPTLIESTDDEVLAPLPIVKTGKLKKFKDYSDLNNFLLSNLSDSYEAKEEISLEPVLDLDYFRDNKSDDLREADILKQAEGFSFVLVKDELSIVRMAETGDNVLSKISFNSRPSGVLLNGTALVVYGDDLILNSQEKSNYNFVKIYDLSSPSSPKLVKDLSFEGNLKDIFIENNNLYFITESKAKAQLGEQILAKVFSNGIALSNKCDGVAKCFAPDVFYFDTDYRLANFLNINSIDLKNENSDLKSQVYLLSENHKIYNSDKGVFVSYFESLDEELFYFEAKKELIDSRLPEVEKEKIKEVENLSDFVLNKKEKTLRISAVYDAYLQTLSESEKTLLEADIKNLGDDKKNKASVSNKTLIHKIRLSENSLDYYAIGEVSGKILNNYSFLQKENYIYIATKSDERLNSEGAKRYYFNIYIFDLDLKLLGKMENISSKEEIFGVRFLAERAFLVSAEKDGSLFVISLKDKTKPEFAGTLKIPGENVYFRPVDENGNKFLSLSYGLEESSGFSVRNGIKLSLFDFSDLKSPRELDSYLIGDANSDSIAFLDRNSFYYNDKTKNLAFPASFKEDGRLYFSGFFAFKINDDKLELQGKLDHSLGGFYNQVDNFNSINYLDNSVKRIFIEENKISSFSNKFFRSAIVSDIENASSLDLIIHSDDLLVSSYGVGNPTGIGFDEGLNNEENVETYEENIPEEYLSEENFNDDNLNIPDYFEEPGYIEEAGSENTEYIEESAFEEPVPESLEEPASIIEEEILEEPLY